MLSSMLSLVKGKAKIILGVVILVLASILTYNIYNYGQLKEKNSNLNIQYAELVSNQTQLRIRAQEQQDMLAELRSNNEEILYNYNRAIENIDKLRGMNTEQVREQKPVIKKKINDDYIELQNRFSCITGDVSKCSNN